MILAIDLFWACLKNDLLQPGISPVVQRKCPKSGRGPSRIGSEGKICPARNHEHWRSPNKCQHSGQGPL